RRLVGLAARAAERHHRRHDQSRTRDQHRAVPSHSLFSRSSQTSAGPALVCDERLNNLRDRAQKFGSTSPPGMDAIARNTRPSRLAFRKCTEPSEKTALAPPLWKLAKPRRQMADASPNSAALQAS